MNYIREINAFYDHMEWNPLSASAVTLWHALMHMNNKTMWAGSFTVAGAVLRIKSGLTESSFKRARNELKEKGYIDFEPSKNRKAPTYKMISLCKDKICGASPLSTCGVEQPSYLAANAEFSASEKSINHIGSDEELTKSNEKYKKSTTTVAKTNNIQTSKLNSKSNKTYKCQDKNVHF